MHTPKRGCVGWAGRTRRTCRVGPGVTRPVRVGLVATRRETVEVRPGRDPTSGPTGGIRVRTRVGCPRSKSGPCPRLKPFLKITVSTDVAVTVSPTPAFGTTPSFPVARRPVPAQGLLRRSLRVARHRPSVRDDVLPRPPVTQGVHRPRAPGCHDGLPDHRRREPESGGDWGPTPAVAESAVRRVLPAQLSVAPVRHQPLLVSECRRPPRPLLEHEPRPEHLLDVRDECVSHVRPVVRPGGDPL